MSKPATKEEFLQLVREIGAGRGDWRPLRAELLFLGMMAKQLEPQMGQDGRPTRDELVAVWRRMAADGDAEAQRLLSMLQLDTGG
jgi:hypothetical protein